MRIPRCYFQLQSSPSDLQLHGFCDASSQAYAAVLYFCTLHPDRHVEVRLIASKTRVAPLTKPTIPRLELLGAVLLSRLADTVLKLIKPLPQITYWVDSTTVLYWIKNEKLLWKQYASHRVQEIRRLTDHKQWRHCPGQLNPADLPSRGLNGEDLICNKVWWNGPTFLQSSESKWPSSTNGVMNDDISAELRKHITETSFVLLSASDNDAIANLDQVIDCKRFRNYMLLLRTTAFILRFVEACQKGSNHCHPNTELSATEISNAEKYWIRCLQGKVFKEEINSLKKSNKPTTVRIKQFGLLLDCGILKYSGRISNSTLPIDSKHPILLPQKHSFIDLLVMHFHKLVKHSGVNDTLMSLRERYWILRGRQTVKRVIRSCVICLKHEGLPYSYPTSPDLPSDRVSDDPLFAHTGIDFAGPLIICQHGGNVNEVKTYICLFTCASTRAIHLELTRSLNVEQFLLAFRRFVSRRGLPAIIWSDNAKTFKSTAKELQGVMSSPKTRRYLSNIRVEWKFIPDRAPWWGGFWERMVKSVKRCLRKCIGRASLNFDELCTLLVEVESVINSRPLTYINDDAEGIS